MVRVEYVLEDTTEDKLLLHHPVTPYRPSLARTVFVHYLLGILTFGFWFLVEHWLLSVKLLSGFTRQESITKKTTHVRVDTPVGPQLVPLFKKTRPGSTKEEIALTYNLIDFILVGSRFVRIDELFGTELDLLRFSKTVTRQELRSFFHRNVIDIRVKPAILFLLDEVLHPLFFFQFLAMILWYIEDYAYYAVTILVISVGSAFSSFRETRRSLLRLRDMSRHVCTVKLLQESGDEVSTISSSDLVVGDKILLEPGTILPGDFVLTEGDAIVSEAMLTGESKPVVKAPFELPRNGKIRPYNMLYSGTFLDSVTPDSRTGRAAAVLVKPGPYAIRGHLSRGLLSKSYTSSPLYKEMFKFLAAMSIIAIGGVAWTLFYLGKNGLPMSDVILKAADIITIIVPPELPICVTTGIIFAINRLEKSGIYCTNPRYVNQAASLDTVLFDKTGTLTQSTLALADRICFDKLWMKRAMSVCHTLMTGSDGRLMGDNLDVEMFKSVGSSIVDPNHIRLFDSLVATIHKRFPFRSKSKRMSVICSIDGKKFIFVKGAPELIAEISNSSTVPGNYYDLLRHYAEKGQRVIALAYRDLSQVSSEKRKELESDLTLLGLLVFVNSPKPESRGVVKLLNDNNITVRMVTGDNPMTAKTIALNLGIIPAGSTVRTYQLSTDSDLVDEFDLPVGNYRVITGQYYRNLDQDQKRKVLRDTLVFARMSPNDKYQLVKDFKELYGMSVAMVGDGSNDSKALKASDCGLSLSNSESSIAAPFVSQRKSPKSIIKLIREGRCSLVTSFQTFKFVVMYSFIQFITVTQLYYSEMNLTDLQYLYVDLFLILPLSIFMSKTGAYKTLSPRPPKATLFSKQVVGTLFAFLFVSFVSQRLALLLLRDSPWYSAEVVKYWRNQTSQEVTMLFLLSNLQTIYVVLAVSKSKPFRKSLFTNKLYAITLTIAILLSNYLVFTDNEFVTKYLGLVPLPLSFRAFIFGLALLDLLLFVLLENAPDWVLSFRKKAKFELLE